MLVRPTEEAKRSIIEVQKQQKTKIQDEKSKTGKNTSEVGIPDVKNKSDHSDARPK